MNLGTFLILLVVIAIVGLVIRGMVKDKRAGKSLFYQDNPQHIRNIPYNQVN